ncbi:SUMF1/EgtB/PvdO family nonheme iron enzyme [candidate division KSB1 bacterium]|nr:SUMF1/EgtB/PvdO family nonheme iron enzyme [candidate division KSB1 bacterium]
MKKLTCFFLPVCIIILTLPCRANNIQVGTPTLPVINSTAQYAMVQFDLSWDNSFRDDINWDAAWIFIKYRTSTDDWQHALLNTVPGSHTIPADYTCSVGETGGNGMGLFIYRDANGSGNTGLSGVQVRWEYGSNGVVTGTPVTVQVFAIEMVFVPQATFAVDESPDPNHFYRTTINTGDATVVPTGTGGFLGSPEGGHPYALTSPASADWPNGYRAFYCMKYEISQGQYAAFLNTLTNTQDAIRFMGQNGNFRHTIGGTPGNRAAGVPDRACNYFSWMDGAAYADWAGLRPMTELEFEKACRGPFPPVAEEYAWGNNFIAASAYTLNNDGTPDAVVTNAVADPAGNVSYFTTDGTINGPLRCGIFAGAGTTRPEAGASYYGIMEMSGNLSEGTVTIDNIAGRGYSGTHGDGILSSNGHATNSDWPGYSGGEVTGADGSGSRGGSWDVPDIIASVSARDFAHDPYSHRDRIFGFRCVRSAP